MDEKSFEPKVGLIIQGPLTSKGINGKTWGLGDIQKRDIDLLEHDCLESIEAIAKQLPSGIVSVVATWSNQPIAKIKQLKQLVGIDYVVKLDEPSTFNRPGSRLSANDYRQFWSTLQGLYKIEDKCQYVIKVRTDQVVDLKLLLTEFEFLVSNKPEAFFTPNFRNLNPFWLADFFFGGSVSKMRSLLEELCRDEGQLLRNSSSAHSALFLASSKVLLGMKSVPTQREMYLSPLELSRVWSKMVISSEDLITSLVWRGHPMNVRRVTDQGDYTYGKAPTPSQFPKSKDVICALLRYTRSNLGAYLVGKFKKGNETGLR